MQFSRTLFVLVVVALTFGLCAVAFAETDTDDFTVSATVTDACTVTAEDLSFGDYDPFAVSAHDATTSITVRCTFGTGWELSLSEGVSASYAERTMMFETNPMAYNLFIDAERLSVWGDGEGNATVSDTGDGDFQVSTVYGRIPAGQTSLPAGAYQDTITATVTY